MEVEKLGRPIHRRKGAAGLHITMAVVMYATAGSMV